MERTIAELIQGVQGVLPLHPHLIFESLAYAAGFWVYRIQRRRQGDFLEDEHRWSMIVAVVLGAALGSKLLHHLADPVGLIEHWRDPRYLMGGKTIVGGLLGGWLAVEGLKRHLGIQRATGDLYVVPLCIGIAIGRVGCFLTGLEDTTHGTPTTLFWGVDLGDGIPRHPVRLLEIGFALVFAVYFLLRKRGAEGSSFLVFMAAYMTFRLFSGFLKPVERLAGMGAIQWASLAGLVACAWTARRRARVSS